MKTQAHIVLEESFGVSPEVLFAALSDHEGMSEWMGVRVSVVAGPADGGAGTLRRVHARGLSFDEEITYFDPPRRMVYRIVRGVPLVRFHRGEILVEPWGETGSRLTWDILLDARLPGVARAVAAGLEPQLRAGLSDLRAQLAAAAA